MSSAALEWALRVIQSSALGIHAIIDITDPCTGAKSYFLQVEDSLPGWWFLPAVGILRAVATFANFDEEDQFNGILFAQAVIASVWCGAAYYHLRRKHHPVAVVPACLFVVSAVVVTAMRVNLWFALAGTVVCAVVGFGLGWVFVKPVGEDHREPPREAGGDEATEVLLDSRSGERKSE